MTLGIVDIHTTVTRGFFINIPRIFGDYTFLDRIQIYQIPILHSEVSACLTENDELNDYIPHCPESRLSLDK
jgi:hypothetical protein